MGLKPKPIPGIDDYLFGADGEKDIFDDDVLPYRPPGALARLRQREGRKVLATLSLVPTIVSANSWSSIPFEMSPYSLFRGDFLYLDCDGLLIERLLVGKRTQGIGRYTPARYFNETRSGGEELARAVEKLLEMKPDHEYEAQRTLVDQLIKRTLGQAAKYRGRPVKLDTQEVGNQILLDVRNPTDRDIWAHGTLEGQALLYE